MLLWIKLCGFLKNMNKDFAKFVLMIEQIAGDLRAFLIFFGVVLLMFTSACRAGWKRRRLDARRG